MPIENEYKWVLEPREPEVHDRLAAPAHVSPGFSIKFMRQGYLTPETRIREFKEEGLTEYVFSFKRPVNGRMVEIETPMSREDFDLLWTTCQTTLTKTRYKFSEGEVHWDVDFLGDGSRTYFALAEAEVPKDRPRPPLHTLLEPFLIAPVDDNKAYSSHALADRDYALARLDELRDRARG